MDLICPSCRNKKTKVVGRIPSSNRFAGRATPELIPGGDLYLCIGCSLQFRHPRLNKNKLDALYEDGDFDNWQGEPKARKDWKIASSWIKRKLPIGAKILDVGCSDGAFLEFLGDAYQRFGIEVHGEGRKRARRKGIVIVGDDFCVLDRMKEEYDAAMAVDVIEHVHDPYKFLSALTGVVRTAGLVLISTGNTDAISWRMMGSKYWYCTIAEHISFINRRWVRHASSKLPLIIEDMRGFSHVDAGFDLRIRELGKNVLYHLFPSLSRWLRDQGFGKIDVRADRELLDHPPSWMSARDHFAILFRKQ